MEVIETLTDESPAREMEPWKVFCFRIRRWWIINVSRRIPRLVWYGDEVDVRVTFKGIGGLGRDLEQVFKADQLFDDMGIRFDAGSGCHGRDWEWDWSLSGPISVIFRGRAKHAERRVFVPANEPKLKLVS